MPAQFPISGDDAEVQGAAAAIYALLAQRKSMWLRTTVSSVQIIQGVPFYN